MLVGGDRQVSVLLVLKMATCLEMVTECIYLLISYIFISSLKEKGHSVKSRKRGIYVHMR